MRDEWAEREEMARLVEYREKGDGEDSAGVTGVWEPYESGDFPKPPQKVARILEIDQYNARRLEQREWDKRR